MNIVIPDKIHIPEDCVRELQSMGIMVAKDTPISTAQIISRIKDAEVITAKYIDITKDMIDAVPNLKYIVSAAAGYDSIDVTYAKAKGVTVVNCPTHHSVAVAEHSIALLLGVARNTKTANACMANGEWDSPLLTGVELHGKQAGLIGYGTIGLHIEKLLTGFGANVSFVNSRSNATEVDTLVAESDILIVCAQLNRQTRHLLNDRRLSSMKSGAILVNVSRGAIVDQTALLKLLKGQRIRGAGLDVFENEPLFGAPTPQIMELAKQPNVLTTPHIGYNTEETARRLGQELIANIKAILDGTPINIVSA